jgi:two-component system LytT family response regulator
MTIRVIIVDDEPLAREGIRIRLKQQGDIEIVAECENGSQAIQAILLKQPDLVFLDIKMPKISGFDVVAAIAPKLMPLVIFVTAFDQHAIQAFRSNALDYLLKPVDNEEFIECLNRARSTLLKNKISERSLQLSQLLNDMGHPTTKAITPSIAQLPMQAPALERLVIKSNGHVYLLKSDDIIWVEAQGDYVSVHTDKKSHLVRETMKNMEQRLTPQGFQRVHRSNIVNLAYVRELITLDSGDYQIILQDDTAVKLSRNYRDTLYTRLNAIP